MAIRSSKQFFKNFYSTIDANIRGFYVSTIAQYIDIYASYVKLLLQGESEDRSRFVFNGNSVITGSIVKYGTGSLYIPNQSADTVSISTPGSDFLFPSDFTIELWNRSVSGGDGSIFVETSDNANYFALNSSTTVCSIYLNSPAPTFTSTTITPNTWQHLALTRTGSLVSLYVDGVYKTGVTNSTSLGYNNPTMCKIGGGTVGARYIDDLRITNGICRYPDVLPTVVGGSFTISGSYYLYTFTGSVGTFSVPSNIVADVLIVAGGGGGSGFDRGGGGGGGGMIYSSSVVITGGSYPIIIGSGGAGGASGNANTGSNGNNSSFYGITAIGGGSGGSSGGLLPKIGGSGGGGCLSLSAPGNLGASGTAGQGNAGGNGATDNTTYGSSGGGGGAGSVGGNGSNGKGGNGGNGLTCAINGNSTYYAGGGGGSTDGGKTAGFGGLGGGGNGVTGNGNGVSGTANTGGGGGGGGTTSGNIGGSGGSGIVIIRIPNSFTPPTQFI